MGRAERRELIRKLEERRGSRVLCYLTSDRAPAPGFIADDAVRPIYHHLRSLGHVPRLDLFLYSRGGAVDVPWRIVSALRVSADEWNVLVPFRANSAATLLSLGADTIVMGPQGELGPIDPIWSAKRLVPTAPGGPSTLVTDMISIEDVMAYVRFVRERWELSEQESLTEASMKLVERVDAVSLGSIYRTHLHIRDVARQVLLSRREPAAEPVLSEIVRTLAEEVHAHGHAINFKTASALGLPIELAEPETETLMWRLFEDFEEELKILSPVDPAVAVATTDLHEEDWCSAMVESADACDRLLGRLEVRARRALPPALNVVVNLTMHVPPDSEPKGDDKERVVETLQKLKQQINQQAQQSVYQTLSHLALIGVDTSLRAAKWERGE